MSDLQTFKYEDTTVRTVEENGETWWVLKDICEVLDLGSPHKIADRLDDDEKGRTLIPTLGGLQELTVVNESGLYHVILRSNKPKAKPFRKWVTNDVLPAIRKTGKYAVKPEVSEESKPVSKEPAPRYYPEKATSIGEIVNLIKILRDIMKAQNSSSMDIARVTEKLCDQFGIRLHYRFVNINAVNRGLSMRLDELLDENSK